MDNKKLFINRELINPLSFKAKGLSFLMKDDTTCNMKSEPINLGTSDFSIELFISCYTDNREPVTDPDYTMSFPFGVDVNGTNKLVAILGINRSNRFCGLLFDPDPENFIENRILIDNPNATPTDDTPGIVYPRDRNFHIVITRKNLTVTVYLDGKFLQSKDLLSIINYDKFVFGCGNTENFKLGRVFNYCVDADYVKYLWNNGNLRLHNLKFNQEKFEPIVTPPIGNFILNEPEVQNIVSEYQRISDNKILYNYTSGGNSQYPRFETDNFVFPKKYFNHKLKVVLEYKILSGNPYISHIEGLHTYVNNNNWSNLRVPLSPLGRMEFVNKIDNSPISTTTGLYLDFGIQQPYSIEIYSAKVEVCGCIAEYLPKNICKSTVFDSSGQGNNLKIIGYPDTLYNDKSEDNLITGTTAPTIIPHKLGLKYLNTINGLMYISVGTKLITDWKELRI